MAYCTTACFGVTTVRPLATNGCITTTRESCESRLLVIRCDIPASEFLVGSQSSLCKRFAGLLNYGVAYTATNGTVYAANTLRVGYTGKLRNWTWADPSYTDFNVADCLPTRKISSGRSLTFEDFNAQDSQIPSGATTTAIACPYYDFSFYREIKNGLWNFGHVNCNGDVYLHVQNQTLADCAAGTNYNRVSSQGTFVDASVTVTLAKDTSVNKRCIQYKKVELNFLVDPYDLIVPYINVSACLANAAAAGLTATEITALTALL